MSKNLTTKAELRAEYGKVGSEATSSPAGTMAERVQTRALPRGLPKSARFLETPALHRLQVDRVWSGFSDAGEEYLCLRLSPPAGASDGKIQTIGNPPPGSAYRLVVAAEISVTLHL